MNLEKSIQELKKHLAWLNDPKMHVLDNNSFRYLKNGVFYGFGRDKMCRPIIILNLQQMDINKNMEYQIQALSNLLEKLAKFMYAPGKIENWIVIIETNGLGLLSIPFGAIKLLV